MEALNIISLVFSTILGGGWLINLLTAKIQIGKAKAEQKGIEATVEGSEIDNVEKAVAIWRGLAESMEVRNGQMQKNYDNLLSEVQLLRQDVKRQSTIINKILRLLDSIDHTNLEQKIKECKDIAG